MKDEKQLSWLESWNRMDGTGKVAVIIAVLFIGMVILGAMGVNFGGGPAYPTDNFMERPY